MRIKIFYNNLSEDNYPVRHLFPDDHSPRFIHPAKGNSDLTHRGTVSKGYSKEKEKEMCEVDQQVQFVQ